ncbi:MAG: hypothetical protein M0R66_00880 [Candidatus Omnitrophica bacterium]|nr:hypothetical protein [Candidatus Omnitrophota bacterium]
MAGSFKNKYFLLFLLVLLFFFVRLTIMFSSEKIIWQGEEPFVGVVTKGIIEGWAMPPIDFQQTPHFGGSVFNAIAALPLFVLIGPQVLALRLTSVLFHAFGMVVLFLLFVRYFSMRAAFFACCFYIFSPPLLTARSLIFNGGHAETAVFDILILFIFLNLVYRKPSVKNYSVLGFLSGFSLWYAYSNLISIINYSIAWLIKDRKFFLNRRYLVYCVSFIIGFLPWFIFNLRNHFKGFEFVRGEFSGLRIWHPLVFLHALGDLIFKYTHKIFMFDQFSIFAGRAFNIIYYSIFIVSFLFISLNYLRKKSRPGDTDKMAPELPIITFPVIFFIAYASSGRFLYDTGNGIVDYRYDIILLPFIFMTMALFLDKLCMSGKKALVFVAGLLFASLLFMGIAGNARFIYSGDLSNSYLSCRAYDYRHVGRVAFIRYGPDIDKVRAMIAGIKNDQGIEEAYCGYGEHLSINSAGITNSEKYIDLSSKLPSERAKKWYFWGIGEGNIEAFYKSPCNTTKCLQDIFLQCDKSGIGQVYRNYLYFGMLARLSFMRGHESVRFSINELAKILPREYVNLAYMYYGITKGAESCRLRSGGDLSGFCSKIEPAYRKYCYIGIGAGIADFFSCDFRKAIVFIGDNKEKEFLLEGMGLYLYKISNFDQGIFEARLTGIAEKYKNSLRKGSDIFRELVDPQP